MPNRVLQPTSMEGLKEALQSEGHKIFAAGCTDLMIRMREKSPEDAILIDLSKIQALKSCERAEEGLRLGAMCTMTELASSTLVRSAAKVLSCAASQVGSTQIRNRATLGGNVANAAQCADTIPALIALEAEVELLKGDGSLRRLKVEDFVTGIGRTLIAETEVLIGFILPKAQLDLPGGYCKIGSREAVTIAKINCAGILHFNDDKVDKARIAFGSLGQRGFYSKLVSEGLLGLSREALRSESTVELFAKQVEEAIPGRASMTYKCSAVKAAAVSVIEQALVEIY